MNKAATNIHGKVITIVSIGANTIITVSSSAINGAGSRYLEVTGDMYRCVGTAGISSAQGTVIS
jgi:hypothetical protein